MDNFNDNFQWMAVNVFLALLGVIFSILIARTKNKILKIVFIILWLLFIPNTIYLVTDLQYLPWQIPAQSLFLTFLIVAQFMILAFIGIVSYIYAMKPITVLIQKSRKKSQKFEVKSFVFIFNFIIAFGIILGKLQRTESWYVFSNPLRVISDINTSLSMHSTYLFVLLFGIFINIIYFSLNSLRPFDQ